MKIKSKCKTCGRTTYVCISEEKRKLASRIKKDIKNIKKGDYTCYFCDQTDVNLLNSILGHKLFKGKKD